MIEQDFNCSANTARKALATEKCMYLLDRLFDATATQAARTNAHPLRDAANFGPHALQVGALHGFGFDVRVAHLVSDEPSFVADFTPIRHGYSTKSFVLERANK